MVSTLFRDPQARSSALAVLGTLQPRAFGSLYRIETLDSASNYYFLSAGTSSLATAIIICLHVLTQCHTLLTMKLVTTHIKSGKRWSLYTSRVASLINVFYGSSHLMCSIVVTTSVLARDFPKGTVPFVQYHGSQVCPLESC